MDAETAVRPLERKLKNLYFQFVQNSKHLLCMALPLQAVDALRERVEAQDLPLVSLTPCIQAHRPMRRARAPASQEARQAHKNAPASSTLACPHMRANTRACGPRSPRACAGPSRVASVLRSPTSRKMRWAWCGCSQHSFRRRRVEAQKILAQNSMRCLLRYRRCSV